MSSKYAKNAASTTKILIITCIVLLAVLIGLLCILGGILTDEKKDLLSNIRTELTVEAGTAAWNPSDLLVRPDESEVVILSELTPDQLKTPGVYTIRFRWHDQEFSSSVRVKDTVKPTGTAQDMTVMGQLPAASEFVTDIQDATNVTVSYKEIPDITQAGTKQITLLLTDTSGNVAELRANITVIVDTLAPVISGVKNIIVYQGDTVAYRSGITVTDDYDTSPKLTIDSSAVDLNTVGKYTVIYHAADASGNETTLQATVEIREKQPNFVPLETIYAEADKLLSTIVTEGMTKREQVEAIYTWARYNCGYSGSSDKSDYLQGAYVMMTTRVGDCFNYFAMTKLFFERLGIDNLDIRKVKNYEGDSDHFWSLVSLDGGQTWYHFDSTPRQGEGDDFCLVTDAFLDAYSAQHHNCHNRDKSLYPATPEN